MALVQLQHRRWYVVGPPSGVAPTAHAVLTAIVIFNCKVYYWKFMRPSSLWKIFANDDMAAEEFSLARLQFDVSYGIRMFR